MNDLEKQADHNACGVDAFLRAKLSSLSVEDALQSYANLAADERSEWIARGIEILTSPSEVPIAESVPTKPILDKKKTNLVGIGLIVSSALWVAAELWFSDYQMAGLVVFCVLGVLLPAMLLLGQGPGLIPLIRRALEWYK